MHERGDGRIKDEWDEEEEGEDADDAERAEHERDVILQVLEAAAAVVGHGVLGGQEGITHLDIEFWKNCSTKTEEYLIQHA